MNKTIGDLVAAILKELENDVSVSVDIDESNRKQLAVVVNDDGGLYIPLKSLSFSMSEYNELLSDVLSHFKPPADMLPLKRFLVITPSSDKPYNMEYMYEGELLANYAETYDIISHEHQHNVVLTKFVEQAELGDVYVAESKDGFNVITTIMRINDKYE